MLAAKPKTKRALETIQFLLTFASVCAIVETTRIQSPAHDVAGYYAGIPSGSRAHGDRSLGDLARSERRRRETALKEALEQR